MKKILIAFAAAVMALSCGQKEQKVTDVHTLQSPDGKLEMTFQLTEEGTPQYALSYEGQDIILPSNLGFEFRGVLKAQKLGFEKDGSISKTDREDCYSFAEGFVVDTVLVDSYYGTWNPVWGEESEIVENYNEILVKLTQQNSEKKMDIRFRLFNDGLGFRVLLCELYENLIVVFYNL